MTTRQRWLDPVGAQVMDVPVRFGAGVCVIQLSGEVDLALKPVLDAVSSLAIDYGAPVRVDVSRVTFIDSAGLAFLGRLVGAGYVGRWTPALVGAHQQVRETIELAGLLPLLDLTEPA